MDLDTLLQLYYDTGWTACAIEKAVRLKEQDDLRDLQRAQIAGRDEAKKAYLEEQEALLRGGVLTRKQIVEALQQSNRWGGESQPDLDAVAYDLCEIGVTYAYMDADDTLVVELARDFDMDALLRLSSCADDAHTENTDSGQQQIILWWN